MRHGYSEAIDTRDIFRKAAYGLDGCTWTVQQHLVAAASPSDG